LLLHPFRHGIFANRARIDVIKRCGTCPRTSGFQIAPLVESQVPRRSETSFHKLKAEFNRCSSNRRQICRAIPADAIGPWGSGFDDMIVLVSFSDGPNRLRGHIVQNVTILVLTIGQSRFILLPIPQSPVVRPLLHNFDVGDTGLLTLDSRSFIPR
jgi:hypothetical protein